MNSLLNCYNILPCDDLRSGLDQATYITVALNSSSTIDHCFVSQGLHYLASSVSIIDSAINLSDHRPLHLQFDINWSKANISLAHSYRKPVAYQVRWDKGSLSDYYRVTGEALSSLRPSSLGLSCSPGCKYSSHQHAFNLYYAKIIASLRTSERCTIPRIHHAALRPFGTMNSMT